MNQLKSLRYKILLSIYVDDMSYTKNSSDILIEFKKNMMSEFEMIDLRLLYYFLGIKII